MKGWVYVITNKAMPGLVKVGYSMNDPAIRARELNHTGSPHPYIVTYEVLTEEPRSVEQAAHRKLAVHSEGKEWFRCSPDIAITAVKGIVGSQQLAEQYHGLSGGQIGSIQRSADDVYQKRLTEERHERERLLRARQIREERANVEREYETRERQLVEGNKRRKDELLEMSRGVEKKYDELLKIQSATMPFKDMFLIVNMGMIPACAIMFDGSKMNWFGILITSLVFSFVATHIILSHQEGKNKQTPDYLSLLSERDKERATYGRQILELDKAVEQLREEKRVKLAALHE